MAMQARITDYGYVAQPRPAGMSPRQWKKHQKAENRRSRWRRALPSDRLHGRDVTTLAKFLRYRRVDGPLQHPISRWFAAQGHQ